MFGPAGAGPPCLISGRHARLRRDGASWFVSDLGSLNGVAVNDARLHQERKLVEGDVVRFGGAGGEELGGECATTRFSAKRRSSLLKTPAPKRGASSLLSITRSMRRTRPRAAAALAALNTASDAHTASNAAFYGFTGTWRRCEKSEEDGSQSADVRALRQAVSLCRVFTVRRPRRPTSSFLQRCFSLSGDPTTPAAASSSRPRERALRELGAREPPPMLWFGRSRVARGARTATGRGRGGAERCC